MCLHVQVNYAPEGSNHAHLCQCYSTAKLYVWGDVIASPPSLTYLHGQATKHWWGGETQTHQHRTSFPGTQGDTCVYVYVWLVRLHATLSAPRTCGSGGEGGLHLIYPDRSGPCLMFYLINFELQLVAFINMCL